jgi:hypothetical protein
VSLPRPSLSRFYLPSLALSRRTVVIAAAALAALVVVLILVLGGSGASTPSRVTVPVATPQTNVAAVASTLVRDVQIAATHAKTTKYDSLVLAVAHNAKLATHGVTITRAHLGWDITQKFAGRTYVECLTFPSTKYSGSMLTTHACR